MFSNLVISSDMSIGIIMGVFGTIAIRTILTTIKNELRYLRNMNERKVTKNRSK